jgi:hypothetical protein
LQLSAVLLIAAGYKLTGIGGLDSIGALVIGGSVTGGEKSFEKARMGSFAFDELKDEVKKPVKDYGLKIDTVKFRLILFPLGNEVMQRHSK